MPDSGMNNCVLEFNALLTPFIDDYVKSHYVNLFYVPIAELGLCAAEPDVNAHKCTMDHVHPISSGYMMMAGEFLYSILQNYSP